MADPKKKDEASPEVPMDIRRLQAHHDDPGDAGKRALAHELLSRTGPLVLVAGGGRYRYRAGKGGKVEKLGLARTPTPGTADPDPADVGGE